MNNLFDLDEKKTAGVLFSVFSCLYIVATFIAESVLMLITDEGSFAYYFVVAFVSPCAMLLLCLLYKKVNKSDIKETFGVKKFDYKYLLLIILTVFGMYFGLGLINQTVVSAVKSIGLHVYETNLVMDNIWQFLGYLLTFAFLPAIFEELFFRGLILRRLKAVSPVIAVVFSALVFCLYHGSISQFFYQFIYGVILALILINSDSVLPCMIVHFLNNFIVLLLLYIKADINFLMESPVMIVLGVLSVIVVVAFLIINYNKKKCEVVYEKSGIVWKYSSLGIVLTSLLVVLGMVI